MKLISLQKKFIYPEKNRLFTMVCEYEQLVKYPEIKIAFKRLYNYSEQELNIIVVYKEVVDKKYIESLFFGIKANIICKKFTTAESLRKAFVPASIFLDLDYCIVPTHEYLEKRLYSCWFGCILLTRNSRTAKLVSHPISSFRYDFNTYDYSLDIASIGNELIEAYLLFTKQPFKWLSKINASMNLARDYTLDKLLKIITNYKPYES